MEKSLDFDNLRDEIHRKGNSYNAFQLGTIEKIKYDKFYGATDAMLEASMAASSYERTFCDDRGVKVLICYGFLQSLFVMQDAVISITLAVSDDKFDILSNEKLSIIRKARNKIVGHPAYAVKDKEIGPTSSFFPFDDIKQDKFRAHVYTENGSMDIIVPVNEWRCNNKSELAKQLLVVSRKMDNIEAQFNRRD